MWCFIATFPREFVIQCHGWSILHTCRPSGVNSDLDFSFTSWNPWLVLNLHFYAKYLCNLHVQVLWTYEPGSSISLQVIEVILRSYWGHVFDTSFASEESCSLKEWDRRVHSRRQFIYSFSNSWTLVQSSSLINNPGHNSPLRARACNRLLTSHPLVRRKRDHFWTVCRATQTLFAP